MTPKYGIKVMIAKDDWIWVIEQNDSAPFGISPILYNSLEEAEKAANFWRLSGKESFVKVVEYGD
jgi:hypothetical protein